MSDYDFEAAKKSFNSTLQPQKSEVQQGEFAQMKKFFTGSTSGKFLIFVVFYFINVGIAYSIAKARQNKETKVHKPLAKDVFVDGLLFLIAEVVFVGGALGISKSDPWTLLLIGPQLFQGLFTLLGYILMAAFQ
jgi:hypothetical protein